MPPVNRPPAAVLSRLVPIVFRVAAPRVARQGVWLAEP